jgi:hypothetical protein
MVPLNYGINWGIVFINRQTDLISK